MSALHDDPVALVALLVRLRERCGPDVYRRALTAARAAVARTVLAEAERAAGVGAPPPAGALIRLPPGGRPTSRQK